MVTFGNDYKITWVKLNSNNHFGQVENYTIDFKGVRKIPIELNVNLYQETNHRTLAFSHTSMGPKIFVSGEFMILGKSIRDTLIWHEVGHIHHQHYLNKPADFNHMDYRISFIKKNTVAPEEMEADLFSLSKAKKETIIEMFQLLISSRQKINEKFDYGIKELFFRKSIMEKQIVKKSHYFAYGSNLLIKQMAQRCPEYKIHGTGRLDGYKWFVNSRGVANIKKSTYDFVLGTVYSISPADEYNLDTYEGVFSGCYKKCIFEISVDGMTIPCLVYVDPVTLEGKPRSEYHNRIIEGLKDAKLPNEYFQQYLKQYLQTR